MNDNMNDKQPWVLIVEDSPSLAEVYTGYLREEPYRVTRVSDGRSALALLDSSPPQALLLDLKLPDMDGMTILKHIHAHQISTTVVVITGYGTVDVAVEIPDDLAVSDLFEVLPGGVADADYDIEMNGRTVVIRNLPVSNDVPVHLFVFAADGGLRDEVSAGLGAVR